jgi:tetrahydromethanopterin S-methyltransferase subunit B
MMQQLQPSKCSVKPKPGREGYAYEKQCYLAARIVGCGSGMNFVGVWAFYSWFKYSEKMQV